MHEKVTKILIVVVTLLLSFLMLPETQAKTEMAWKWEVSSPDWIKNVDLLATSGGSATDVYAAGYETNSSNIQVAKYWKNGEATPLTTGNFNALAISIFVVDR